MILVSWDQNLRKLVGRHIHFYNPFGGKRVTRYENPQVFPDFSLKFVRY